jgi:hypothetical protein
MTSSSDTWWGIDANLAYTELLALLIDAAVRELVHAPWRDECLLAVTQVGAVPQCSRDPFSPSPPRALHSGDAICQDDETMAISKQQSGPAPAH